MKKIIFLLVAILFSCKDSAQQPTETDIHAPKTTASLIDNTLKISIEVPANHHAYLDAGKDGAFIPITFDWQALVESSAISRSPVVKSSPAGVYDSESGAKLLRNSGIFTFEGNEKLAGKSFQVRSQICDDIKGICYRPTTQSVEIQKL
jgi:hypothetical protein